MVPSRRGLFQLLLLEDEGLKVHDTGCFRTSHVPEIGIFKRLSMHPAAKGRTEQFGAVVRPVLTNILQAFEVRLIIPKLWALDKELDYIA